MYQMGTGNQYVPVGWEKYATVELMFGSMDTDQIIFGAPIENPQQWGITMGKKLHGLVEAKNHTFPSEIAVMMPDGSVVREVTSMVAWRKNSGGGA